MLVHGEAERNDMVEYFGEHLDGFVFAQNGWVQSYGSRCVKPPIVIGDVSRPARVPWSGQNNQSLTDKPVKGMLTGPVTILCWSFPREDVSRETIAKQIALALRDEVADLEAAGIGIIQIDEPALREGLPLRRSDWDAISVGRGELSVSTPPWRKMTHKSTLTCVTASSTTLWIRLRRWTQTSSPSKPRVPTVAESFEEFDYPNEIGPGVYDIHSPNVPSVEWIEAAEESGKTHSGRASVGQPDCG